MVAAYRQEFDIGQRNLLDLLDAENELLAARSRLLTAEFAEEFGVFRTLASVGRLLKAFGLTPPSEAITSARAKAGVIGAPPVPLPAGPGFPSRRRRLNRVFRNICQNPFRTGERMPSRFPDHGKGNDGPVGKPSWAREHISSHHT